MRRIRVLIVDDAVVVRRMLSNVLGEDPDIEVVGIAANGALALARIPQVKPDLITLDVEMPEMDGIETLRRIRKEWPDLPVLMFSSLTERGATATLEALSLGAADYVTKPQKSGSIDASIARVRDELVPKIKALCGPAVGLPVPRTTAAAIRRAAAAARPAVATPARRPLGPPPRIEVVAIGVSTGGPNALSMLLPELPADLGVPILIVQHMPPVFTRLLAERLAARCAYAVCEGVANAPVVPGTAWIAPGDHHMTVVRAADGVRLALDQNPAENSCRPAVDPLFRSIAAVWGAATLAVVLTGMGQDGLRGCEQLRAAGAQILAQDQASSVVWGMPGAVAEAGLADKVLPLAGMADEIVRRVRAPRGAESAAQRAAAVARLHP